MPVLSDDAYRWRPDRVLSNEIRVKEAHDASIAFRERDPLVDRARVPGYGAHSLSGCSQSSSVHTLEIERVLSARPPNRPVHG
jgi:hypothetical protein